LPPPVVRSSSASISVLTVVLGVGACATGQQLDVHKVDAVVQSPANVALYLKIARPDGQPVTLLANDFKVYEDGKQVPAKKAKRALLPVKYAIDRYVLVMVDLSGPLVDSEYLSTLQDAVASLTERVGKDARMAISGFDGDGIVPFMDFDESDSHVALAAMKKFRPRSRNIDLWGTFVAALDILDAAAKRSSLPHHSTTLILVTDRVDKAGRHSHDDAVTRAEKSPSDVYVVGIGDGINREQLERVGKTGSLFAREARDLGKPFIDLADRIEAQLGQDYLFSYCSPQKAGKRSGKHTVELRIATSQWHASVEHEFSTRRFTKAACDPEAKPEFKANAGKDAGGESDQESEVGDAEDDSDTKPAAKSKKAHGGPKKTKPVDEQKTKPVDEEEAAAAEDTKPG
jgi:von Willebrand factor type A domain